MSLERIPDGIVVRGTVQAHWRAECSVCLRDLDRVVELHADELFEREPIEGETYPLDGHEIDLEQLVRDTVLLELPLAPHCAEPCEPAVPARRPRRARRPSLGGALRARALTVRPTPLDAL